LNQAVFDPTVPQCRTGSSGICKNGWYFMLWRCVSRG